VDVLVTYDIATLDQAGERRLARVAAVCERFGVRVQYSVFECRLNAASLQAMIGELLDTMHDAEDSIHIYRFDRPIPEVRSSLGRNRRSSVGQTWIVRPSPRNTSDP
jgi:CRISPR-associated protein Cas2